MIDVAADRVKVAFRDPFQGGFGKSVECFVPEIGERGLHGMDRALGKMQPHRPVVGDRVDDAGHPGVDRRLARPDVRRDKRHVAVDVRKERDEQFAVLLILGVVGDLLKPLGVERLPDQPIEQPRFLRDARGERIKVVLLADHLGSRRVERREVEPVGGEPERAGAGRHRDRDAVMPEAHPDIPDDQGVPLHFSVALAEHDIARADMREFGDRGKIEFVVDARVVAVFFQVFRL